MFWERKSGLFISVSVDLQTRFPCRNARDRTSRVSFSASKVSTTSEKKFIACFAEGGVIARPFEIFWPARAAIVSRFIRINLGCFLVRPVCSPQPELARHFSLQGKLKTMRGRKRRRVHLSLRFPPTQRCRPSLTMLSKHFQPLFASFPRNV